MEFHRLRVSLRVRPVTPFDSATAGEGPPSVARLVILPESSSVALLSRLPRGLDESVAVRVLRSLARSDARGADASREPHTHARLETDPGGRSRILTTSK